MKYYGPGILLAGAAIGASHLVASTQAGAHYGWSLLGILILINLFKYPFFRYGQRYTAATGESIIHGYLRLGKNHLLLFFLLNLVTGIINIAGVSMVTASLATNFGITGLSVPEISLVLMLISAMIIIIGGFGVLQTVGKLVVGILALSTITALILSVYNASDVPLGFTGESPWTQTSFGFVIMFMGWMPAPIECSAWPSLWMKSHEAIRKKASDMRETMKDFHAGYFISAIMAFVFLALGKTVMYGSGVEFSSQGPVFAKQLISLYVESIGLWAKPLIVVAAFTTMFSTSLTTLDAYPRVLSNASTLLFSKNTRWSARAHYYWIFTGLVLGFLIIWFFSNHLGGMLKLAMTISFLAAPVFAYMNYRVMLLDAVPEEFKPKPLEKWLAILGIVFLAGFGLAFLYWQFI